MKTIKTITDLSRMTFEELRVYLEGLLAERVQVSILYDNIVVQTDRVLWAQRELIRKERNNV